MALQLPTYTSPTTGATYTDSYVRLEGITLIQGSPKVVSFLPRVYTRKPEGDISSVEDMGWQSFPYVPSSDIVTGSYDFAKTLPEFAGAVDA